ncbi:MAG: hypothetical protein CVU56_29565, partial [Deltaproteobacteria bacterium HGW-Deltaproteobacteria-14]
LPTWRGRFSDGEATFFDLQGDPGVGFAQATIQLPPNAPSRDVVMRVETNRSLRVFVDGAEVLAIDGLRRDPWERAVGLRLPATPVRITVKLASSDGRGLFRVRLLPLDGGAARVLSDAGAGWGAGPLAADAGPGGAVTTFAAPLGLADAPVRLAPGDGAACFRALWRLDAQIERPRHDVVQAGADLTRLEAALAGHPTLALEAARAALADGELPDTERRRVTRASWDAVIVAWPTNLVALHGLAGVETAEDRQDVADSYLRRAYDAHPDAPGAALSLARHARVRGREAEALELAGRLEGVADRGPAIGEELVDLYAAYGYIARARAAAERLDERFPGAATTRLAELDRARGAHREGAERLLRAFALEPEHLEHLRAGLQGLRAAGDFATAKKVVDEYLSNRPQDAWGLAEQVRIALQAGDAGAVEAAIDHALTVHPDFAPMELLGDWLAGRPNPPRGPLATGAARLDDIADGRAIVARYLASRGAEGSPDLSGYPVVTLYERRVIDVRADGSVVELTHRVHLVQTKSGADSLGDFRPPSAGALLSARTLKADGRVLWPERTRGKADLSFPELEPGDAIETAWLERSQVAPVDGGYLSAFVFGAWDVPSLEVRAEVRVAPGLEVRWRGFGGAPEPTSARRDASGQRVAWDLDMLAAMPREPLAVGARSFFPFVDLTVAAAGASTDPIAADAVAWRGVAEGYVGRVLRLTAAGTRVREAAAEIARRAGDDAHRARAAFGWVTDEIDDTERFNAFQTPVDAVIAQKKGSRALTLLTLARALGVPAELLLCAPERDGTPEDVAAPTPNTNRFFYPIVRLGAGADAVPVDLSRPFAPFDALPFELYGARCLAPERALDPTRPLFERLPELDAALLERLTWRFDVRLRIAPDGSATGTVAGAAYGPGTAGLRKAWDASDEARRRLIWQQWAASLVPGADVRDDATDDVKAADAPMRWKLTVDAANFAVTDGADRVVQHLLKPMLGSDLDSVPELAQLVTVPARRTPLRVLPHLETTRLSLEAPPGFAWGAVPPELVLARGPHRFEQRVKVDGPKLVVTRTVRLLPDRVEPADYPAFRALIQEVVQAFEARARLIKR